MYSASTRVRFFNWEMLKKKLGQHREGVSLETVSQPLKRRAEVVFFFELLKTAVELRSP